MKGNIEKLISHPLLKGLIRLSGFRLSRSILYYTIARCLIPRKVVLSLLASIRLYFSRYLDENNGAAIRERARRYIRHYKMKLCEDIVMLNLSRRAIPKVINANVEIKGMENFDHAMDGQRGVLAVGSHVGSVIWGTVAFVHFANSFPSARRRFISICTDPYAGRFFPPGGKQDRYSFIPNSSNPQRMIERILAALNAGQIVTTNLDVLCGGASTRVFRLFGKADVLLPAVVGAAKTAKSSGAVVLPWSNRRDEHDRLILSFEQPFTPDEATSALSARLRDLLEKWIRESPEQWIYWDRFHKRLLNDEPL